MSDQTDENLSMATVLLVIAVFVAIIASGVVVLVYVLPVETRPPSLRAARLLHFRRELEAARTRTAVNPAAKKLMLARERLKALEVRKRSATRASAPAGLVEHLALFVDLETRLLEMLDHPLGELRPGMVRRVPLETGRPVFSLIVHGGGSGASSLKDGPRSGPNTDATIDPCDRRGPRPSPIALRSDRVRPILTRPVKVRQAMPAEKDGSARRLGAGRSGIDRRATYATVRGLRGR
jgi:hypothetical protein